MNRGPLVGHKMSLCADEEYSFELLLLVFPEARVGG